MPVYSIGKIREIVDYLYKTGFEVNGKPLITSKELNQLKEYLVVYGVIRRHPADAKRRGKTKDHD